MATRVGSIIFFLMPVFVLSACLLAEARILKQENLDAKDEVLRLSLAAVKPGPSPGQGHKYVNAQTLGGIKDSGPSPGDNHSFVNAKVLGGIKDYGPSPGAGHR